MQILRDHFFKAVGLLAENLGFSDFTEEPGTSRKVRYFLPEEQRDKLKYRTNIRPGIHAIWPAESTEAAQILCFVSDSDGQCGGFVIYIRNGKIQHAALSHDSLRVSRMDNPIGIDELNRMLELLMEET